MVPEYENIDLSEFVQNLKDTYPGQFDEINFSPHTFVPEDLQAHEVTVLWQGVGTEQKLVPTAAKFARRLAGRRQVRAAPSPGKAIWEMLTAEEQQLVEDVAAEAGGGDRHAGEKRRLALLLNRLVADPKLYAPTRNSSRINASPRSTSQPRSTSCGRRSRPSNPKNPRRPPTSGG